ncbi:MAG: 1-deoxy-D-xylulose-5-phosphate synthase, partial [Eubacterium sp.]|nr:1-deoxy-D-xylulose-5-phosphate synthase [Eubacterium sp.]
RGISYPNIVILAPKNAWEMRAMMDFAVEYEGPVAMKYPRGKAFQGLEDKREPIRLGKSEVITSGEKLVILSVGNMMEESLKLTDLLKERGYDPGLVNVRFIKPFDKELIRDLALQYETIITVEESLKIGGFGQMISAYLHETGCKNSLMNFGIDDCFVEHATVDCQRRWSGIDAGSMAAAIIERIQ